MRTFRTRTTAAAATALLAALSLTACQNDGPTATPAPASSAAPATATPDRPAGGGTAGTPTAHPTGTAPDPARSPAKSPGKGSSTGGQQGAGTTGPSGDAPVTEPCGTAVKVTYTPVSRPLNHALLTLTNTGSRPCDAYHAPLLRFDDGQSVTTVNEGSKPQAVVTLAPGKSAYASITLAAADGSGAEGRTAHELKVHFAPRSGEGSTDAAPAVIALPSGTYTDSSTNVTYWQHSMDDALMY
ncbi:DUF4232 domain-containing protein [Streptomyces sp. NPDC016309]|uniref:DUF4232 domain-containing protein n=1 Tax=Streptomyces sp. NPDC016309 TaxID=3364965 RepID=UPI0036F8DCC1